MKRLNIVTIIVAVLVLPCLVYAANHRVTVGTTAMDAERTVTVPLVFENLDGLMAADIPLQFPEGVTLDRVTFEGTRVEHFDLKIANINNEENYVIIGLVTQMTPKPVEDLRAGEGTIANLVFTVNDLSVQEIELTPFVMEEPRHELAFIYHNYVDGRPVGQERVDPAFDGQVALLGSVDSDGLPTEFALAQNYPNPFNPTTIINFALPQSGHVTLDIFNVLGQRVQTLVDENLPAGDHQAKFDGSGLSSGVYFYRITTSDRIATKKMVMLQ